MGRTIPSWRMVAEEETRSLRGFREMLRSEDKIVFDDLIRQCKHYASHASTMKSVVKEVPLIMSMLFGQHKRLMELEKRITEHQNHCTRAIDCNACDNEIPRIRPEKHSDYMGKADKSADDK